MVLERLVKVFNQFKELLVILQRNLKVLTRHESVQKQGHPRPYPNLLFFLSKIKPSILQTQLKKAVHLSTSKSYITNAYGSEKTMGYS